jgi:hypothetical protein
MPSPAPFPSVVASPLLGDTLAKKKVGEGVFLFLKKICP